MNEKTKAITLFSTPYKDRSKIIKVLTKDYGIISLIIHGLSAKKSYLLSIATPFSISEIVFKKNNSDIHTYKDGSIIDENIYLRKNLKYIKIASLITKAVLEFHFPQKNTENIFLLLQKYLKNISTNPNGIYISFLLKILINEGFLNLKNICNKCSQKARYIESGESLCQKHTSNFAFRFSEEEYNKLLVFAYAKSFSLLKDIDVSKEFVEKAHNLFKDLI